MNSIFKKRELSFSFQLIVFTAVLFAAHSYVLNYFISVELFFPIWHIYIFLFIITFLVYTIINYKYSNGNTEIFNTFMMATLLKMIFAIVFLLPLLFSDFKTKKTDVINFFIIYFIFLAFEVYSISRFLQNNTTENQQ